MTKRRSFRVSGTLSAPGLAEKRKTTALNVIAIIQARMGSERLPKKVLLPLAGKTVLEHVVMRSQFSSRVNKVVVATTVAEEDLKIVRLCAEKKISVYVGSEEDVLDRYYQAGRLFLADHIVRVTADCPAIDPGIIDRTIIHHLRTHSDYTSNTLSETFPDGQDVEVFTMAALTHAWKEALLASQREHVTPYMKDHPKLFKVETVLHKENLGKMRWTLDHVEDYHFLRGIFKALYKKKKIFGMREIVDFLKGHPEMEKINRHIKRNAGYQKSLLQDHLQKGQKKG